MPFVYAHLIMMILMLLHYFLLMIIFRAADDYADWLFHSHFMMIAFALMMTLSFHFSILLIFRLSAVISLAAAISSAFRLSSLLRRVISAVAVSMMLLLFLPRAFRCYFAAMMLMRLCQAMLLLMLCMPTRSDASRFFASFSLPPCHAADILPSCRAFRFSPATLSRFSHYDTPPLLIFRFSCFRRAPAAAIRFDNTPLFFWAALLYALIDFSIGFATRCVISASFHSCYRCHFTRYFRWCRHTPHWLQPLITPFRWFLSDAFLFRHVFLPFIPLPCRQAWGRHFRWCFRCHYADFALLRLPMLAISLCRDAAMPPAFSLISHTYESKIWLLFSSPFSSMMDVSLIATLQFSRRFLRSTSFLCRHAFADCGQPIRNR